MSDRKTRGATHLYLQTIFHVHIKIRGLSVYEPVSLNKCTIRTSVAVNVSPFDQSIEASMAVSQTKGHET